MRLFSNPFERSTGLRPEEHEQRRVERMDGGGVKVDIYPEERTGTEVNVRFCPQRGLAHVKVVYALFSPSDSHRCHSEGLRGDRGLPRIIPKARRDKVNTERN